MSVNVEWLFWNDHPVFRGQPLKVTTSQMETEQYIQ
jgi:hypothetical protein